jgi:hypothetical protein
MRDEGVSARPPARAVLSVTPRRNGCVGIALECGHVLSRRLSLCPPSRLPCPFCARAERDLVTTPATGAS